MKRETVKVNVRLYEDQETEIKAIALETDGNVSDIRRKAIDKGLQAIKYSLGKGAFTKANTFMDGDVINVVNHKGSFDKYKLESGKTLTKVKE